jgi:hypothetical protein
MSTTAIIDCKCILFNYEKKKHVKILHTCFFKLFFTCKKINTWVHVGNL